MEVLSPLPVQNASSAERRSRLTNREQQVLGLMRQGLSNREIARALRLSEGTVKVHVHNILMKVGVRSRRGLTTNARGSHDEHAA
jgi:DNA-binding NarL/FixJ family response regulator